ncbi:hypothetical protein BDW66DRAFT_146959 [Aspergillus desertorum]
MAVDQHLIEWQRYFQQMITIITPPFTDLYLNGSQIRHPTTQPHSMHCRQRHHISLPALFDPGTAARHDELDSGAMATGCQQSCDHMAEVLRKASELILQNINPLIIYSIFAAGRFSITFHCTIGAEIPS